MPDHATLSVHCGHCGKSVTVTVDDWPATAQREAVQTWQCPHCGRRNEDYSPRKITLVHTVGQRWDDVRGPLSTQQRGKVQATRERLARQPDGDDVDPDPEPA